MILPFPTLTENEHQRRRAARQEKELREQQFAIRQLQKRLEKEERKQ
jgi:hypothetical protein